MVSDPRVTPNSPNPTKAAEPRVLLVRGARQLVTLRGPRGPRRGEELRQLQIVTDGALLIIDGKIAEVGPGRRVEMLQAAKNAEELDCTGKVVMPGFVDCQTHILSPPAALDDYETRHLRGVNPDPEDAGGAVPRGIRTMRSYSPQRLEMEAKRRLRMFTRYGSTSLGTCSGYGLDEPSEIRMLRVLDHLRAHPLDIVPSFGGGVAIGPEYLGRPLDYLDFLLRDLLPVVQRRRLARFADISVGDGAFDNPSAERFVAEARKAGIRSCVRLRNGGQAVPGAHTVSGLWNAAGPIPVDDTIAVLTPGRAFHENARTIEPARQLIDAGVPVALSTGFNSETSPSCSMPMALSLACNMLRMTPAEALSAATINAAHALDLGSTHGSLESGKWADLLILNTGDYRDIPFQFGVNLIAMVLKRGQPIYPRFEAV
jgi:imidazolonepropionase